jgi:hypothetical protein
MFVLRGKTYLRNLKKRNLIFLLVVFSVNVYSQWLPVDTISLPYSCTSCCVGIDMKFVDETSAYWSWQKPFCTPTNRARFGVVKTHDSFTTNGYFAVATDFFCGSPTSDNYLKDLDVISYDTVYVSYTCAGSYFKRTFDSGSTWIYLSANRPEKLFFVNGHLGYGFIGNNFYRFWNDSCSYVSTVNNFTIDYYQLFFADSLTGYVLLQPSQSNYTVDTIIRTIDGGLTWTQSPIPSGETFYSLDFQILNDTVAYIYAYSNYYYKTVDAGNSWIQNINSDTLGYIQFLTEAKLYNMHAIGTIVYYNFSIDSGVTWSTAPIAGNYFSESSLKMINDSVGYAIAYSTALSNRIVVLKTINNGSIGISENKFENGTISIYPNPIHNSFTIVVHFQNAQLEIYNILGEKIHQQILTSAHQQIQLNASPGIYFVRVTDGEKAMTQKVVIE